MFEPNVNGKISLTMFEP